jgi:hypothetical protein
MNFYIKSLIAHGSVIFMAVEEIQPQVDHR